MFQSFDAPTSPDQGPPRLDALRAEMAHDGLDAFLVPRTDAHQGEYVAPCDERLSWLTGFTGSAGFCVALADQAGVFIDGRYGVQVKEQVALSHFMPVPWPETKLATWLLEALPEGGRLGYDPWLHTVEEVEKLTDALADSAVTLHPSANLVDRIWADRPAPPVEDIMTYPDELSGEAHHKKRERLAQDLKAANVAAMVLTLPDSICWLLNIRGGDIKRNPVVQCFATLHDNGRVDLFVDPKKLTDDALQHLGADVTLHPLDSLIPVLLKAEGPIGLDPSSAPQQIALELQKGGVDIIYQPDPSALPKARKNPTEIESTRTAHIRDARAMVEFLAWLDAQPPGKFTEIDVVKALEGFRQNTNTLRDISFETISGSGPNGAIVHYRVTENSNRTVGEGELLLVDSGAQYVDGTTDITRTIAIGTPSADQKACFTRVLQGMIAISRARFPKGLAGRDLDALARAPLWMAGQDYDHGTGHGVGVYLSVHEGPQRLSRISHVPLEAGMILSNEPGYYREGEFGIRIENLIVVQAAPALATADPHREMLSFETLTWVPIDRRLIDLTLLSPSERAWIDDYHAQIAKRVTPSPEVADWLARATAPL